MKKYLLLLLSSLLIITGLTPINASAKVKEKSIAQELLDLNDPNWNEFLNEVDLKSKNIVKSESYLKVYENYSGEEVLDKKSYTKKEYLEEVQKPQTFASKNVASWLKVSYEIYPVYINKEQASILASYEWLQMPRFQQKEMFTVSTDTNIVVPGSNSRVNASFWPNISCPAVVGSYNSISNPSKFEFDTNGVSFIQAMNTTEFNSLIKQQPNWEKYFSTNPYHDLLGTTGSPKGVLGFMLKWSNSTTNIGKLTFTYNHQQVSINFNPSINIDSTGNVSIGGVGAGVGFDKVSTTIDYNRGQTIQ